MNKLNDIIKHIEKVIIDRKKDNLMSWSYKDFVDLLKKLQTVEKSNIIKLIDKYDDNIVEWHSDEIIEQAIDNYKSDNDCECDE